MSGLFTAAFLRRIGWDVDVFERSAVELVGRGAGITTHPELLEALEKSGAGTRDLGIEVERRITIDRQGRVIGERPLRQILTSWDRLQRLLRETIDPAHYHLGHTFERVEQEGGQAAVRVHFAEGRVERADLLVGGDGIRSGVRAQVAPQVQPIYSGYYIWRGAPNEADLAPETLREHLSLLRVLPARAPAGDRLSDLRLQQRPAARPPALQFHLVPGRRRRHAQGHVRRRERPPARLLGAAAADPPGPDRADARRRRRASCRRLSSIACATSSGRSSRRSTISPRPRIVFGRVALVGDAGSSARPHMGFGVAKAGGDAQALADALAAHDDVDAALAAYNAVRQPIGERIMLHGRKLGTHLGVDLKTDEDRRMWKLLQGYDAMMDWIAVPNFLAAYR